MALCVALAGCGEARWIQGRADTIPIFFLPDAPRLSDQQIEDAEFFLGLDIVVTDERYGAVTVVFYEGADHGSSGALDHDLATYCTHTITTGGSPRVIAHEIGHSNGLGHHGDPENLMHRIVGAELNDEQVDLLRWHAWFRLESCE